MTIIPVVYRPDAMARAIGCSTRQLYNIRPLTFIHPSKGVSWVRADQLVAATGIPLGDTFIPVDGPLTVRVAAGMLHVSVRLMHRWVSEGRVASRKTASHLTLIDPESLVKLVGGTPERFLSRRCTRSLRTTGRLKDAQNGA